MPYKNKKDKTEAVRRHRARKEAERKQVEESEKMQKQIGKFLTEDFGFGTLSLGALVQTMQHDFKLEKDKVRDRKTGEVVDNIEVFFGLNMMVVIETPQLSITNFPLPTP